MTPQDKNQPFKQENLRKAEMEKTPESYINIICSARTKGLIDEWEYYVKEALLEYPRNPKVMKEAATIEAIRGNNIKAEKILKECLVLEPHYVEAYINLGLIYCASQQYTEAIKMHSLAVEYSNNASTVVLLLSKTYFDAGDYSSAMETCKPLLEVKEMYEDASLLIAKILLLTHSYDEAASYLSKSLETDTYNENTIALLIECYLSTYKYELAYKIHNFYIDRGDWRNSRYQFLRRLLAHKFFEEGIKYIKENNEYFLDSKVWKELIEQCCIGIITKDKNKDNRKDLYYWLKECIPYITETWLYNKLSDLAYELSDIENAIKFMGISLSIDSKQICVMTNLLSCLSEKGEWHKLNNIASKAYINLELSNQGIIIYAQSTLNLGLVKESLAILSSRKEAQSVSYYGLLRDIYQKLGNKILEERALIAAIDLEKNTTTLCSLFYYYIREQEYSKATDLIESTEVKYMGYSNLLVAKSMIALMKDRDIKKSINYGMKAVQENAQSPETLRNLGNIYHEVGRTREALLLYRCAVSKSKNKTDLYENIGNALFNTTNYRMASIYLEKSLSTDIFSNQGGLLVKYISLAILCVGLKDISRLKHYLVKSSVLIKKGVLKQSFNIKSKQFITGYYTFLTELIRSSNYKATNEAAIYFAHIGDSHCLTYSLNSYSYKQKQLLIDPLLVKGVKAWHLTSIDENKFKSGIDTQIRKVNRSSKYSKILISVGEIDCRIDEGITPLVIAGQIDLYKSCKELAEKFVNYLESRFDDNAASRYYCGIPAPMYEKSRSSLENETRKIVVSTINNEIEKQVVRHKQRFINIYQLTLDKLGYNNKKHMSDLFHLHPLSFTRLLADCNIKE